MADRTCTRCQKVFSAPCRLKSHLARKIPCAPVEVVVAAAPADLHCDTCGKTFTRTTNLYRHRREICVGPDPVATEGAVNVNGNGNTINMGTNIAKADVLIDNRVNINVAPWDSENYIRLSLEDVQAALAHSEWVRRTSAEQTDVDTNSPGAASALMALVEKGHSDPRNQNVYLSPTRADQAMVMKSDGLHRIPLDEATRLLFDRVAKGAFDLASSKRGLAEMALKMLDSVGILFMEYGCRPEHYVDTMRRSMAAHLENQRKLPVNRAIDPAFLPVEAPPAVPEVASAAPSSQ
jgi:hypothetical protein